MKNTLSLKSLKNLRASVPGNYDKVPSVGDDFPEEKNKTKQKQSTNFSTNKG